MSEDAKQAIEVTEKIKDFEETITDAIVESNNIFICGHINPDYDSLSSMYGMARICKYFNKYPHFIIPKKDLKESRSDERILFTEYIKNKYIILNDPKDIALTDNDLLIILDTCEDARTPIMDYDIFKNVIVIDHHDEPKEPIEYNGKPAKTLRIENISSAAEIVYYLINDIILSNYKDIDEMPIDKSYFTSLLAGIYLDTHKDTEGALPSTHKCLVKLKEYADEKVVEDLFAKNFKEDSKIYDLVFKAESFTNRIGIVVGDNDTYTKVEIAKASDILLQYKFDVVFVFGKNKDGNYDYSIRTKKGTFGVAEIANIINGGNGRENAASGLPIYVDEKSLKDNQSKADYLKEKVINILRFKHKKEKTDE